MQTFKGRPVITGSDHPELINRALHRSVGYWNSNMPSDIADDWTKRAADAWEVLQQDFEPGEERTLFMSPDQLELAIVAYGCELLDDPDTAGSEKVLIVNGILKEIDRIKSR